jgi:multisubunit Na+/H+ antiporter MnhF subunit
VLLVVMLLLVLSGRDVPKRLVVASGGYCVNVLLVVLLLLVLSGRETYHVWW